MQVLVTLPWFIGICYQIQCNNLDHLLHNPIRCVSHLNTFIASVLGNEATYISECSSTQSEHSRGHVGVQSTVQPGRLRGAETVL